MPHQRALLVPFVVLGLLLSGCVDNSGDGNEERASGTDGTDAAPTPISDERHPKTNRTIHFDPEGEVPAPVWAVGDLFGQHIFDDPGGSGFHVNSVVVSDTGGAWTIATDSPDLAKRDAYWDFPFMGDFQKTDLATSAYGLDWDFLFDFPLKEGKTWTRNLMVPHTSFFWSESYDVTFTATYAPRVPTSDGAFPGFDIQGTTAEGLLFRYYYVPAIGWYDHFFWYDLSTEAPDDWRMHAMSMGTGKNWTGTYHTAEAVQRIEHLTLFCPAPDPECAPAEPSTAFSLSTESSALFGVVVAGAMTGHSKAVLNPPEGDPIVTEHTDTNAPNIDEEPDIETITTMQWLDLDAVAGEWRFAGAGAGVFWGAYINVAEIQVTEGTL